MDGKGRLTSRNWEFTDHRHSDSILKPTVGVSLPENNASGYQPGFLKIGAYSDRTIMISEPSSMNFSWVPQRIFLPPKKINNHLQGTTMSVEMIHAPNMPIAAENAMPSGPINEEAVNTRKPSSRGKKADGIATKVLRPKEPKKRTSMGTKKIKGSTSYMFLHWEKKSRGIIFNGDMMDFSGVPTPICSCTGVPRQCYRWGAVGWQSSCCTTNLSEYPLPMSSSRPGARTAGRKMSIGAYAKLLHRLTAEGHDLAYAVDLKNHWARHGTNKFVIIK